MRQVCCCLTFNLSGSQHVQPLRLLAALHLSVQPKVTRVAASPQFAQGFSGVPLPPTQGPVSTADAVLSLRSTGMWTRGPVRQLLT